MSAWSRLMSRRLKEAVPHLKTALRISRQRPTLPTAVPTNVIVRRTGATSNATEPTSVLIRRIYSETGPTFARTDKIYAAIMGERRTNATSAATEPTLVLI